MESAWIHRVVNLQIQEATGLLDSSSNFCTVRVDDREWNQSISKTYKVTSSKIQWGETFRISCPEDFHKLKVTLWSGEEAGKERPCGVVSLLKEKLLSGVSDWFLFQPLVSAQVSGDILASIMYTPPEGPSSVHRISVSLKKARNLHSEIDALPSTYATVHRSDNLKAFRSTAVKSKTANPVFEESFTIDVDSLGAKDKIYVSLWNDDAMTQNPSLASLGFFCFGIQDIIKKGGEWEDWFRLDEYETSSQKPTRSEIYDDLINYEHQEGFMASFPQKHTLFESPVSAPNCQLCCDSTRWQHTLECTTCGATLHTSCITKLQPDCSMFGAIKLQADCKEMIVLPSTDYQPLLETLKKDQFTAPLLLGSLPHNNEDMMHSILKIFEVSGQAVEYLKALVRYDVSKASDTHSLLRANTLASKAWDAYVRTYGKGFLQSVWKPVIAKILETDRELELDPTRTQDSNELGLNAANLEESCEEVLKVLMQNLHLLPLHFQDILSVLRKTVDAKFPGSPQASYTAVSNFLFLRFLIPALISPRSFGLVEDELDALTNRRLLLVGKTLQNLANFVEFGQKQPYMAAMNRFLKHNKFRMEILVELISSNDFDTIDRSQSSDSMDRREFATLCSDLVNYLDHNDSLGNGLMRQVQDKDLARVLDLIHLKMDQTSKKLAGKTTNGLRRTISTENVIGSSNGQHIMASPKPVYASGSPILKTFSSSLANLPFKKAQIRLVQSEDDSSTLSSDNSLASPPLTPKKKVQGLPGLGLSISLPDRAMSASPSSLKSPKILTVLSGLFGRSRTPPPSSASGRFFSSESPTSPQPKQFSRSSTLSRTQGRASSTKSLVSLKTSTLPRNSTSLSRPESPVPQISHANPFLSTMSLLDIDLEPSSPEPLVKLEPLSLTLPELGLGWTIGSEE